MRNIWLLCRVQFKEIFAVSITGRFRKISFGLAFALLGILFISISVFYTVLLGNILYSVGQIDYLPAVFFTITSLVTLTTTVVQIKGVVFGSKDYETLLPLPLKNWQIVASKLIMVYFYEFVFTLIFMLPADIFYMVKAPSAVSGTLAVTMLFLVPLIPMAVASLVGFLFSLLFERLPFKNILQVLLTVALLILIFVASVAIGQSSSADIAETVITMISKAQRIYPLMEVYVTGCVRGDPASLSLYLVINAAAVSCIVLLIGAFYQRLNGWIHNGEFHRKRRIGRVNSGSEFGALLYKEAGTYFFSPPYFLHTVLGGAMVVAFASFLCYEALTGGLIYADAAGNRVDLCALLRPYLSVTICFFVGMTSLTSSSISMEGPQFWMVKTLPIRWIRYFGAKVALNQMMTGGCALIASIVLCAGFGSDAGEALAILTVPQFYIFMVGVFGLSINLKYPKLQWSNEQAAVKNSSATLLSLLIGIAVMVVVILLAVFLYPFSPYAFTAVCCILFLGNGLVAFFSLTRDAERLLMKIY